MNELVMPKGFRVNSRSVSSGSRRLRFGGRRAERRILVKLKLS